jgi:hypothetical protein
MPALFQNPIDNKHINMKALASLYKDVIRKKTVIKKGTVVKDEYGKPKERKVTIDGEEKTEIITYAEDITKIDNETSLTFESKNQIELVERKMSKPLFACVLRVIYATDNKRTKFNPDYIQNCLNLLKPFNASSFNTFGFNMSDFANPYDYDWQNPVAKGGAGNIFSNFRAEEVFDAYIEREGFHPHMGTVGWFSSPDADRFFFRWPSYIRRIVTMSAEAILDPFGHPHPSGVFVLNSEELATIYHLPGLVASVPTLPRIDSRKAVAPVNLPV